MGRGVRAMGRVSGVMAAVHMPHANKALSAGRRGGSTTWWGRRYYLALVRIRFMGVMERKSTSWE